ncbi:hypothetical protein R6Q59_035830 [Mikania micrantha]
MVARFTLTSDRSDETSSFTPLAFLASLSAACKHVIVEYYSKLINVAVPGTIDERAINTKTSLGPWERNENHTLCLNFSKAIGCTVVNIGTQDFIEGSNPSTLVVRDHLKRATLVLEHADRMGCKRNLTAKDIAEGSPNLNHAFVAHIFQHRNGLSTPEKPDKYGGYLLGKYGDEHSNHPKFDEDLLSRAVGGKNKGKVYGLSSVIDFNTVGKKDKNEKLKEIIKEILKEQEKKKKD